MLTARTEAVSGFKVGAGANINHDGWHLDAEYTWFNHDLPSRANTIIDGMSYFAIPRSEEILTAAASRYIVQFNRVDAMINRNFYTGHFMVFKPWLGLLGAWDTQKLNYQTTNAAQHDITTNFARLKQTWWGVGPYGGGEATYYFTKQLG